MKNKIPYFRFYLSLIIGIIGIFLLFLNFIYSVLAGGLGGKRPAYTIWEKIANSIYYFSERLPLFLEFLIGIVIEGAFLIFSPLSLVGIFLSIKSLNSPHRKLAIFAIILNSINFLFALFIAWFLFGLARGM